MAGADQNYLVYIATNPGKTVLYTGMTNDLAIRMKQHYENRGKNETFAGKYFCYNLIYYERFQHVQLAIEREDEIKNLTREKKLELILKENPRMSFIKV